MLAASTFSLTSLSCLASPSFLYSAKTWSEHDLQGPHLEESLPSPFQDIRLRREKRVSCSLGVQEPRV